MARPGRRRIHVLALARGLSGMGTYAAAVALSYAVYDATRSAFWLSGTLILTFGVTGLLAPFAGALVDGFDRRRLAVASDLCAAAIWGVATLVADPAVVIALAFAASVVELVSSLSSSAAVPNLVDEADLPWAVSFVAATTTVAKLSGPALGGLLYAAGGAHLVFACNAVSFVVSALILSRIPAPFSRTASADDGHPRADLLAGFRVLAGDRLLRAVLVGWTITCLAMNGATVADPPLAIAFGMGASGYAAIDTAFGLGAFLGAAAAGRLVAGRERRWVPLGIVGVVAGLSVVGTAPWFGLLLVGVAMTSGTDAIGETAAIVLIQRRADDASRGRTLSALSSATFLGSAVGFVAGGAAVEAWGPQSAYTAGALQALAGLLATLALLARSTPRGSTT